MEDDITKPNKANPGIIILISVLTLIIIIGITALILLVLRGQAQLDPVNRPCSEVDTSALVDVSNMPCVLNGNVITSDKLTVGQKPLTVITPSPYPYKVACASFCSQIVDGNCVNTDGTINMEQNDNYQQCLIQLAPQDCIDQAMPIGLSGNTVYYAKYFPSANTQIQAQPCIG